jgi:hypothetical protein
MYTQTRKLAFLLLILMATTSCTSKTPIEFLAFDGCPNSPVLLERLLAASPKKEIVEVDLMKVKTGDSRLGWGAPTILVDGKDLFGVPASLDRAISCRNWSKGLPEIDDIKEALKDTQQ